MEFPGFTPHSAEPTKQFLGESVQDLERNPGVYPPLRLIKEGEGEAQASPTTEQQRRASDIIALGLEAFIAVCAEEDPELLQHLADGLVQGDLDRRRDILASFYDEVPQTWLSETTSPTLPPKNDSPGA